MKFHTVPMNFRNNIPTGVWQKIASSGCETRRPCEYGSRNHGNTRTYSYLVQGRCSYQRTSTAIEDQAARKLLHATHR